MTGAAGAGAVRVARTNAEAHLYMDLHPCRCGATAFPRRSSVVQVDAGLASRYDGDCAQCGQPREFTFLLPEVVLPPNGKRIRYGGAEPSQLLDAGEWLEVADRFARAVPPRPERLAGTERDRVRRYLASALAALDEVVKFIPPGQVAVPLDDLWSDRGRTVLAREPGRFQLRRLVAVRDAYLDALARLDDP